MASDKILKMVRWHFTSHRTHGSRFFINTLLVLMLNIVKWRLLSIKWEFLITSLRLNHFDVSSMVRKKLFQLDSQLSTAAGNFSILLLHFVCESLVAVDISFNRGMWNRLIISFLLPLLLLRAISKRQFWIVTNPIETSRFYRLSSRWNGVRWVIDGNEKFRRAIELW